jgi:hypothetical protein
MTENAEMQQRIAELEERERKVTEREKALAGKSIHRNHYDRIDVSTRTMDIIIIVCVLIIAALVVAGVFFGKQ